MTRIRKALRQVEIFLGMIFPHEDKVANGIPDLNDPVSGCQCRHKLSMIKSKGKVYNSFLPS